MDKYLDGDIAKDIYEEADMDFERKIFKETQDLDMLQKQYDGESSLQKRLDDFKKALLKNQILEEFDREIFESIIEKVIVGGYNENGESDPYKIIFIYKTGFKDEIKNAKQRFGKSQDGMIKKMCSNITSKVDDMCSFSSDSAFYDYSKATWSTSCKRKSAWCTV